jgi:hypothetical protein
MIHIVFNEPDIQLLEKAIELDNSLQGEIIQVKDDYAVGPLKDIYTAQGTERRREWWREVLAGGDYDGRADDGSVDDPKTVAAFVGAMRRNPGEIAWIWAAQNKHDVCGYYWLTRYLKELQGRVSILYLNNLPFINEKGSIFYPSLLSQIPAREFLKAKKLAREITPSELEVDPDEWTRLCEEDKGVRLLEGGKRIASHPYDFYDGELQGYVTTDWQKAAKIIHQHITKAKQSTGDAYLLWRLKQLIGQQHFDVQGRMGNMKEFEVKLKQ